MNRKLAVLCLIVCLVLPASAQKGKAPASESHYRLIAIDTVIQDAKGRRPAHADGRMGFVAIYHKDSKHCLVEYVSRSFAEHVATKQAISAHGAADPMVNVFEKHLVKPDVLQAAIKIAGFDTVDLSRFSVSVH